MTELKEKVPKINIDIDKIEKLANLARIKLTEDEKKRFQKDIGAVLDYVSQLKEAPVVAMPDKLSNTRYLTVELREDKDPHEKGSYSEELLKEVPETKNGFVKVKRVFE